MSCGQTPKCTDSYQTYTQKDWLPSRQNQKWAQSRVERTNRGNNPTWAEGHVARLPSGQKPRRQTPSWIESQVDRTKREQNPELKEPIADTILRGEDVMWPDSKLDKIQVDKHPLGPTHKLTKEKVNQTRFERPYRGRRPMWTDCHMDRRPSGQNSSRQASR